MLKSKAKIWADMKKTKKKIETNYVINCIKSGSSISSSLRFETPRNIRRATFKFIHKHNSRLTKLNQETKKTECFNSIRRFLFQSVKANQLQWEMKWTPDVWTSIWAKKKKPESVPLSRPSSEILSRETCEIAQLIRIIYLIAHIDLGVHHNYFAPLSGATKNP